MTTETMQLVISAAPSGCPYCGRTDPMPSRHLSDRGRCTLPAMVDGKTRRPSRVLDMPAYDPRDDAHPNGGTMGRVAFFEYREDAVAAGAEWCPGWDLWPQYVGRYDLWVLSARRKSWSSTRSILVEACLDPHVAVIAHAHVPDRYSYGRLVQRREALR